jgi:hypothetical protein
MKNFFFVALFSAGSLVSAQTVSPLLPAPPQDQGLPYTRSAEQFALKEIKDGIAVFPGSRYGYVKGYRVRLSDTDLLRGEAAGKDGLVYVPGAFAALVGAPHLRPKPIPADLGSIASRWVYSPGEMMGYAPEVPVAFSAPPGVATLTVRDGTYYSVADIARAKGLKVTTLPDGVVYIGAKAPALGGAGTPVLDSIVTLFDTPDKFANPDIATKSIPTLARQGKWTDHVKVTPEQLAILTGPETDWPTAPKSEYDFTGFNTKLLGSKVPPPGVYPRLLFSPEDVPMLAARIKSSKLGQMSLIEMEYLFKKSWWDPTTSDGQIFEKLAKGDTSGLEFDSPPGTSPTLGVHVFKGEKPGIFNSHVAYIPECLTSMALYCLLTNDDAHGREAAAAIATYYRMREPIIDEINAISDSEFGSSLKLKDGTAIPMDGNGAATHWRTVAGAIGHMNLGLSLDLSGKWMTAQEKDSMRRIIAKSCYGRRSYGQDAPVRFRDVNWVGWDLTEFIANQEIEGLKGFDPEVSASGMETVRAFCDWGIDDSGVVYESNGKTPGSFQFITLSMIATARRGENYFGHPHLRKLLTGQIEMTSPSGRVTVNSGTQYSPFSRQPLSFQFADELKAFFPDDRRPDYMLGRAKVYGGLKDEGSREWVLDGFNPATFKENVSKLARLRLPDVTYPGFVRSALYDTDFEPTTRADLNLPLDFSAPTHGVFSSYSDRSTDAAWINMMVRPDHYLGAGHHHADSGMFHFSALDVDWFTQSQFDQEFSGKYFNLVQIDGHSEPESLPGGTTGYNAAGKYLGAVINPSASAGLADLTYAYSYRWLTQPQQVWPDSVKAMPWELDPSPNILKIFAGTARYKLREWWANYTYSNYIATSRAPFNPMQYVYRTAGLVRGAHPYGFVVDDLKKDDAEHLYQWAGMLSGGVWKASVPGLPDNEMALAYTGTDGPLNTGAEKPAISPQAGQPLLLVCPLGLNESGDPKLPLIQVGTTEGPSARNGGAQYYDRLMINQRAGSVAFKILLLPVKAGEKLPQITYDGGSRSATIKWDDQTDVMSFTAGIDNRTRLKVMRGDKSLIDLQ